MIDNWNDVLLGSFFSFYFTGFTCLRIIFPAAITCSKLAIETLGQGVKYIQT